jgi:hypothetical protein
MQARLLDDRYVPAGFEMVLPDGPEDVTGRFWNLWFNTTLSDDPARWDDETHRVNARRHRPAL